jgi:hypothetical protein
MIKQKYNFTSYDLGFKRKLEKKRGSKIPDEKFYKFIQKQKKWLEEYVGAVKKLCQEKPLEVKQFINLTKSIEERIKNKELYEELAKIKKLTVAELQKLLAATLKEKGYINLEFSKPEIKKDVIIEFTVQDNKTDRGEYDSRIQLQRILKKKLEVTNWRLMSDGACYRLGILTGRLKGLESEEDLLSLIKKQN